LAILRNVLASKSLILTYKKLDRHIAYRIY